jgi:3-dehydroquinate synthase
LNFGHTVGHAVETVTGYGPVLHGEAVAYGMVVAAHIAVDRGMLAPELRGRLIALLRRVGLPTRPHELGAHVNPAEVVAALGQIKKIRDSRIRFVLPVELGSTVIADDVTDDEVYRAILSTASSPSTRVNAA